MEQTKIWSHFQNRRHDVFSQAENRHRFLLGRIPRGRILNIGVGHGGFERIAAAAQREVYSLDPDGDAVARIAQLGISKAVEGSIDAMPFDDGYFDGVVCSEVLEHLGDDLLTKGLAEIRRVMRSAGELHGTVPADENLSESEVICPCCGALFHRWGHAQSFSQERLRKLLDGVGSAHIERRTFVHWPSLNWKGKTAASLRMLLATFGSSGGAGNYYFTVRKDG